MNQIKILIANLCIILSILFFCSNTVKAQTRDYSDLNGTYSRLSHTVNSTMYIGASVDADDITSWVSLDADDDDNNGANDDDSYNILPDLTTSDLLFHMSPKCTNTSAEEAILAMWLDVDGNGSFESDEIAIAIVPAGTNNEEIDIIFQRGEPFLNDSEAIGTGRVAMRFTIAPNVGFNYNGSIDKDYDNGESEDYWISITETCERVDKKKWFFGYNTGLDFNTMTNGYPTPIGGLTETKEGSGAVTTHSGNIVTYTDGNQLWRADKDNVHHITEASNGTLGGDPSSSQGALFIKAPQRNDYYYIFANPSAHGPDHAAYYSVMDLSKDNGTGAYARGSFILNGSLKGCSVNGGDEELKKVEIKGFDDGQEMSELITGIETSDRSVKWIILHGQDGDTRFYIARIDVNGIRWTSQEMTYNITSFGTMRLSPDGRTIIICHTQDIMMYDFDPETGVISNERALANGSGTDAFVQIDPLDVNTTGMSSLPSNNNSKFISTTNNTNVTIANNSSGDNHSFYGAEFSSSGKTLYVSAFGSGGTGSSSDEPGYLYQFDLSDRTNPYLHTLFCLENFQQGPSTMNERMYGIATLQRGDDYKMYFVDPGRTDVGVIDNPDVLGVGCNIDETAVALGSLNITTPSGTPDVVVNNPYVLLGLPNFMSNADMIQCGLYDFGDHDPSYGVAAHYCAPLDFLSLGIWCDADADGSTPFTSNYSLGDDYGGGDDEDLDLYFPPLIKGMTEYTFWVPIETDETTFTVSGWIDLDGNGVFDDSERSFQNITSSTTLFEDDPTSVLNSNREVKLSWVLPDLTNISSLNTRFRVARNSTEVSSPTGLASDGEVEDHIITVLDDTYKTITFDLDGGTGVPNPSLSFSYQMAYRAGEMGNIPPMPSKGPDNASPTGYYFSHWENIADGTTYTYTQRQQLTGYADAYTMPNADVTLKAIWLYDTDNDGVGPDVDLDDDNDGILDVDENTDTYQRDDVDEISPTGNIVANSHAQNTNNADDTSITSWERLSNGETIVLRFKEELLLGSDVKLVLRRTSNWNNTSASVTVSTSEDNVTYTAEQSIELLSLPTNLKPQEYLFTTTDQARYIKIDVSVTNGKAVDVYGVRYLYSRDTDGDGIVDRLDPDSDGDGCYDADEAYQTVTADIDGNGMYGSGDPEVDIDGKVIGASYGYDTSNLTTTVYDSSNSICDDSDKDYGDAPNSYNTAEADDGAAHFILNYENTLNTADLMLGSIIDSESDASFPFASLNGGNDDANGVDDEDGVTVASLVENNNISVSFTNLTGKIAYIAGFIDFNCNDFFDDNEMASSSVNLSNGTITLSWQGIGSTIPVVPGASYARFRIGTIRDEVENPYGEAIDGEVEDYPINIVGQLIYEDGVADETIDVPTSFKHIYNSDVDISNTVPIRSGYQFVSWVSKATYTEGNIDHITAGTTFSPGDQDAFKMPRSNVILTAQWASLTTTSVTNINSITAKLNGKVGSAANIVENGFIYSYIENSDATLMHGHNNVLEKVVNSYTTPVDESAIGEYSSLLTYGSNNIRKNCYFRSYIKITENILTSGNTVGSVDRYIYGDVVRFTSELRDLSLHLDGTDDCLVVDSYSTENSINRWGSSNTFSIDLWAKKIDSNNAYILDNRSTGGYSIEINTSGTVTLYSGSTQAVAASTLTVDDSWHHIAITHKTESSNSITKIYIDGEECANRSGNNLNAPNADARVIIGDSKDGGAGFNGYIDDMRFWNVELTEAQINRLAYSSVMDNPDNLGEVKMVGSGEIVTGLVWDNLLASFGFNVKSTTEGINSSVDIRTTYASQDEAWNYPFFHEDSRLNSDANPSETIPYSYNIVAVGDAKPSVMLPRVNWKYNATTDKWLTSNNWVGLSYPGEGLVTDLALYPDVSSSTIADDTNFTKFTIINGVVTGALKPIVDAGTHLEVNYLIDNDTSIESYSVDGGILNTLTVLQSVRKYLFVPVVETSDYCNIVINEGSIEM